MKSAPDAGCLVDMSSGQDSWKRDCGWGHLDLYCQASMAYAYISNTFASPWSHVFGAGQTQPCWTASYCTVQDPRLGLQVS